MSKLLYYLLFIWLSHHTVLNISWGEKTAWDLREDDKFYTRTEASREI